MAESGATTVDETEEYEQERDEFDDEDPSGDEERQPQARTDSGGDAKTKAWAIRGALIGAFAGGAAGAGLGALAAARPESLRAVKDAFGSSGREVARAAAGAASDVVTSSSVKQLVSGAGNGDRAQLMKDTAREAGAAAAKAARETLVSLRQSR
jgi:hypothetical protein